MRFHSFNNYNSVSLDNLGAITLTYKQLHHIYLKSSFRSIKQHPVRPVPVHLQFNQFTKPIFFQTFQYWKGQGCYFHHIKTEYAIISKSIAVFYSRLEKGWTENVLCTIQRLRHRHQARCEVKKTFSCTNYLELSFKLLLLLQSSLKTTMSCWPIDDL